MNYNKKSEQPINLVLNCFKAAFAGMVVFLISTFIFALVLAFTDISDSFIKILSYASVILSSYVTSFLAIKLIKKNGLVVGLLSGIFVFIFIIILKFIFAESSMFVANTAIIFLISIAVAMINSIILVNKKKNYKN